MSVKKLLHSLVSIPLIYNFLQQAAGRKIINNHLQVYLGVLPPQSLVLELGGGTGVNYELLPECCRYICSDNDLTKLTWFHQHTPQQSSLLANATQLPIGAKSVDVVLCSFVSHHISNDVIDSFTTEAMRVLKPDGQFIFLDAYRNSNNWIGMLLWRYDRGDYPRSLQQLQDILNVHGKVISTEKFHILHNYVIAVVTCK